MPVLDHIRIYPVKGLRGVALTEAEVEPWGLAGDRRWMIVEPSGRFLTQREVSAMAAVEAALRPGALRLSVGGAAPLEEAVPDERADRSEVIVWNDLVPARLASARAADWLTRALGHPCRLVYMADPAAARRVDPVFAAAEDRVSFADGFPLLATTTASLDDLNRRLAVPVPMDRFRPNLVIGGADPWAEDRWSRLVVGGATFDSVKDCARCIVTTVDQDTGLKAADGQPLRTLATFRRKARGRIIFGQNLVPRRLGRIAVGDLVNDTA